MKAIASHGTAGLGGLRLVDLDDPGAPGPGEVRVRIHASSLNYHDLGVVTGHMHAPDGRIPMADGAGVVEAIGAGVEEFAVGDHVVSTFFPSWLDGEPPVDGFATVPGDGVDGFAREVPRSLTTNGKTSKFALGGSKLTACRIRSACNPCRSRCRPSQTNCATPQAGEPSGSACSILTPADP
jgi:hypothetical protein